MVMSRLCVVMCLVVPVAVCDNRQPALYGAPPATCYAPTVTVYDTVTEVNTKVETTYITIVEEVAQTQTEYVTETQTEAETQYVTETKVNVATETEQVVTTASETVYETQVVTQTQIQVDERSVTITETQVQKMQVTKCAAPTPSYDPSRPRPTYKPASTYHSPPTAPIYRPTPMMYGFGGFKGYSGFNGFDFKGFNPFRVHSCLVPFTPPLMLTSQLRPGFLKQTTKARLLGPVNYGEAS
ncbi:hypothetical protein Hamer_G016015 [Homarus americanus]|uniref:Uncharacterized protein n=1 Tax=Homarus americanus TaxID=6706 RepID=A0A8J5JCW8_HOMAM|nr:hypothetical protein Hamer_G016015 [Homarus americanus]